MTRFEIVLLIIHPSIDPKLITKELRLHPFASHKAGEPRRTPTGTSLSGRWQDSRWNHVFRYERKKKRGFFDELERILNRLLQHKAFFMKISKEGGSTELYLKIPGDVNNGDSLAPVVLERMVDLNIAMGIEVFPKWKDC